MSESQYSHTDGARCYNNEACSGWLRLRHYVYGTELKKKKKKNLMMRFIQNVNDSTECFDDHFPWRKDGCSRQHVWNWLKLFLLYSHMGTDMGRFMSFLARDGGA
ncbi:MAG TPA: hypothetical protein VNI77_07125 [Nitrososphaera sp.]|nr:hypothetical protein [Nitrososphaera sp.]